MTNDQTERPASGSRGRLIAASTVNRVGLGVGLGSLLVLAGFGAIAGSAPPAWVINMGVVLLGVALGILAGFLVSPYAEEEKNFSSYAKYLLAILTGYLASKLDRAIEAAIAAAATDPAVSLRMILFFTSLLASLLITFVARRYPI